jgi:hypothetical protein
VAGALQTSEPVHPWVVDQTPINLSRTPEDDPFSLDRNETEPSVIRIPGKTIVAAQKYNVITDQNNRVTRIRFYTHDGMNIHWGEIPLPPAGPNLPGGWKGSFDPLLYKGPGVGSLGNRVYLTGIITDDQPINKPSGVCVWYTTNGESWTPLPNLVAVSYDESTAYDKPSVCVSWYSSTLNHVYVAYVEILGTSGSRVRVARSTNGGQSFDQNVVVGSVPAGSVTAPQVLVAPSNGYVYVTWPDYTMGTGKIMRVRSPSPGNLVGNWFVDMNGPTGNFVPPTANLTAIEKGSTIPMVRYNWVKERICYVWHEYEPGSTSRTNVYFTSVGADGWLPNKVLLDNDTSCPADQFMPALDFDPNGNILVTYYDSKIDCFKNRKYNLRFTRIDERGNCIRDASGNCVRGLASSLVSDTSTVNPRFIGDYQDVWWEDGLFHCAWIGIPSVGNTEVYLTRIQ